MAYMKVVERGQAYKYNDETAYQDVVSYCCDPTKVACMGGFALSSIETAAAEMQTVAVQYRKDFGKRLSHIIITFKRGEAMSIAKAEQIARSCAQYFAGRYQVLYTVHTVPDIHIHIVMNRVSYVDGKKYPDKYEDRNLFWNHVRRVLNDYGIFLWK